MMRYLFLIAAALSTACAHAADAVAPSPVAGFLQMLFGLGLVVAAIGGIAWAAKKYARPMLGSSPLLKTVASAHLGPRERVVVLEIGEQWLVLGVTAHQVTSLHQLPRGEVPANTPVHRGIDFQALLARTMGRHDSR
jgi:flagellar protein FliO/FliZ